MGGPSYQTPYPVTTAKGNQVIWSWDTKSWGPYKPPPKEDMTGVMVPMRDQRSEPSGSGADRSAAAPAADEGPSRGSNDPSPSAPGAGMPQQKRTPMPTPVRTAARRRGRGSGDPTGTSLLSQSRMD